MATKTLYLKACDFSAWNNGGEDYATMSSNDRSLKGQFNGAGLNLTQYKITAIGIYGDWKRNSTYTYPMGNTNRGATLYDGSSISSIGSAISSQEDGDSKMSGDYAGFTNYYTTDTNIINRLTNQINNGLVVTIDLHADNKGSTSSYRIYGKNIRLVVTYEEKPKYTVTVSAGTGGTISSTGGSYYTGTTFSVTATPYVGYKFKGWANSSGVVATTANPYSFTVSGSTTFNAVFEPILYYVTYNANGGSGAMDGASVYFGNNYTLSNNGFTAPEVTVTFDFDDGVSANKVETKSKTFRGWEDWGDITANTGRVLTADKFDAPYYVRHPNHPDLLQILGYNKFSLASHYVNDGEREGRPCISTDGTRGYYDAGTVVNSLCTTQSAVCRLYAQWDGCTFTFPSVPERDGYEFLYWKWVGTNNNYSVTELKINADATFIAVWKQTKKFGAYAGDKQATVYVGDKPVKEIYVGSTKVYG